MTASRTRPNILAEADHLTDDSVGYGALILARAIGHAMQQDGLAPHDGIFPARRVARVAAAYGPLLNEILPGKRLTARRIVVTQDAAELAFA
jgi:hypothetical protein